MLNTSDIYDWYYNSSFNSPLIIFIIILSFGGLILLFNTFYIKKYNIKGTPVSSFNYLYTTNNNNGYIMMVIIFLLILLILSMNWFKQKSDVIKDRFNDSSVVPYITNPTSNFKIDLTKQLNQMEINSGTVIDSTQPTDIYVKQLTSTLYGDSDFDASYDNGGNSTTSNIAAVNGMKVTGYATLDSLGKSLTDTLGGIDSSLGYTIIDEQLGTFKGISNPDFTYNNIANYNSTINGGNLAAANDTSLQYNNPNPNGYNKAYGGSPVFLQKDFEGVANIFAPNIFIAEGSKIPNIYMNDKIVN